MRIIAGRLRGRKLEAPTLKTTRPTSDRVREALFSMLESFLHQQNRSFEGLRVLDAFAGSGALGFEALSRGAAHITFMEKNMGACLSIVRNAEHLRCQDTVTLLKGDALEPSQANQVMDLVFLDPPYKADILTKAFQELVKTNWIGPDTLIVCEESALMPHQVLKGRVKLFHRLYGQTAVTLYGAAEP